MVLSFSELDKDGSIGHFEFEKFAVADGKVVLQPYPGGRPATALTLTALDGKKAVFENPKKDYPTRITYEVVKNHLLITLSDPHGNSDKSETFDLKRS